MVVAEPVSAARSVLSLAALGEPTIGRIKHRLTERHKRGRPIEPLRHTAINVQLAVSKVGRDTPSLWVLARRYGDTRWRANRRIDVELFESNAFRCQPIDMLCRNGRVAETGKVTPSHIVNEHQDDIGMCRDER